MNEAINSIHTYRDAIVQARPADSINCDHSVIAAYLLSPYIPTNTPERVSWKDVQMPARLFHREYRGNFRFGAATMKPGQTIDDIDKTLLEIFDDVGLDLLKS